VHKKQTVLLLNPIFSMTHLWHAHTGGGAALKNHSTRQVLHGSARAPGVLSGEAAERAGGRRRWGWEDEEAGEALGCHAAAEGEGVVLVVWDGGGPGE